MIVVLTAVAYAALPLTLLCWGVLLVLGPPWRQHR
jgi:hypothetical protein